MRFHEAGAQGFAIAEEAARTLGTTITVLRDLLGRIRLVVEDRGKDIAPEALEQLAGRLAQALGCYAPSRDECVLRATSFHDIDGLMANAFSRAPGVRWLERTAVPWSWRVAEPPNADEPVGSRRIVLYGVKGGVGRSTAVAVLGLQLARAGKRVLVVDLDLESPGIGPLLLGEPLPEVGIVDWLVEDLVGNAGDDLREALVRRASVEGTGELWVAPAAGAAAPEAFIDKLARIYQPAVHDGVERSFASRVAHLLDALEHDVEPEVTLIDSRAGIHELSATALTALGGDCLLFASDTASTWSGYELLLRHWGQDRETLRVIRERLHVVAALVPEAAPDLYVASLRSHAYDLFARSVYDDQAASDEDVFSFNAGDSLAPHHALEIHWRRRLLEYQPRREGLPEEVELAYRPLFTGLRERGVLP